MANSPLTLRLTDLTIERGGREIVGGLSFAVTAGEVLVLTGANGSGKTTLLRALAGFLRPAAGNIVVSGGAAAADDPELSALCHYVGHRDAVKPKLTVAENVMFWADYLGGTVGSVDHALDSLDLSDLAHLPAAFLSAGQKRRLGLARLLSAPRAVWLLDEPTTALDATHQQQFARLIDAHRKTGGIVIAATHMELGLTGTRSLNLSALPQVANDVTA